MTTIANVLLTEITKIDRLGLLLAQIADLEAEATLIKDELKNGDEGHIEGNLFRGCVTLSQRNVVDNKAIFTLYNVPAAVITEHTKTTAIITLKVSSK
jgi:hypothetical protein